MCCPGFVPRRRCTPRACGPRYLQVRPDVAKPRDRYVAEIGARLYRRLRQYGVDASIAKQIVAASVAFIRWR
jgi:hypothetical protein